MCVSVLLACMYVYHLNAYEQACGCQEMNTGPSQELNPLSSPVLWTFTDYGTGLFRMVPWHHLIVGSTNTLQFTAY